MKKPALHVTMWADGLQVAVEWATVRAEAQRAKAAADKPRQKAAGQLIAALKREIAALGAHRRLLVLGNYWSMQSAQMLLDLHAK